MIRENASISPASVSAMFPQSPASALNDRLRVETLLEETWRAHSSAQPPDGFFTKLLESVQLPQSRDFLRQRAGQLSTGQGSGFS